MRSVWIVVLFVLFVLSCKEEEANGASSVSSDFSSELVKAETLRSWKAYKEYAWGDDVLLPLSKGGFNWYEESLGISPIDAYSTLSLMGLKEEAAEIEEYVLAKNWDQDISVQVFEVNIRILGGLLAMYQMSGREEILASAIDMGNRLMPAFRSPTGLPYHSVNLQSGQTSGNLGEGLGNIVNVAQAASYLVEFGILSYYAKDPQYYQAAKKATRAIHERRSEIGLPGDYINVETGKWTNDWHYIQAGVDSYYEYMLKASILFGDLELRQIWEESYLKIKEYIEEDYSGRRFYACVNMHSGEIVKRSVSLYDAFFPAVQILAGDTASAEMNMQSWDWLWDQYGLLPTRYLYDKDSVEYANSELNPEIIESAYYLHQMTGEEDYLTMIKKYWKDINVCCRDSVAFHAIHDVRDMRPKDYLATYFFAETLKYFYLAGLEKSDFDIEDYIFSTEAHPFRKDAFEPSLIPEYLGLE